MLAVFFSWQSDRPEKLGRYFIERCLRNAIANLAQDLELQEAVREEITFDKDTKDEPGFVKIFDTILEKIEKATVFVPDFTFVALRPGGQPTPNPNVLIEYGYALRAYGEKGERRIMPVMNVAYGKPDRDTMPFDLIEHRNAITYNLPEDAEAETRSAQQKELTSALQNALKKFFESQYHKDTQPKQQMPPLRELRNPRFGRARFRAENEPLGAYQDPAAQLTGSTEIMPYYLMDGPAMWLRVATNLATARTLNITELEKHVHALGAFPLSVLGGASALISSSDGSGFCSATPDKKTPNVAFAFRDGEVWTISTWSLRQRPDLIILEEPRWSQSLQIAAEFLNKTGFPGPYRWVAGMEGVNRRFIAPRDDLGRKWGPCMSDLLERDGIFSLGDDPSLALEPFFELVWDQCRLERPPKKGPAQPR